MYAKLVFPQGTKNTEIARDIARTIANSTGAGGSTVGALEFVDAVNSTIDDTVAANWSLVTGMTIPTGATEDEQDKRFDFEQTHANGSTKTVSVRMHNEDPSTGFTVSNNTAGYNSVVLRPVLDKGQAYESTPLVCDKAQTASSTTAPGTGVTAIFGSCTVRVIARDKVIAVIGDRRGYQPGRSFEAILEAPTQAENNIGRNKPAQTLFRGNESFNTTFASSGMSQKFYLVDFVTTNVMGSSYPQPLAYYMCDTLHEATTDKEVRMAAVEKSTWIPTTAAPSNSDPTSQIQMACPTRDTTQADGWGTTWNYSTTGDFSSESFIFGVAGNSWPYSMHGYSFDPISSYFDTRRYNPTPSDAAGNPVVQLQPVMFRTGNQGGFYDFASECGLYVLTNNVPRGISELTGGGDTYIVLRTADTGGRDGAIALKV